MLSQATYHLQLKRFADTHEMTNFFLPIGDGGRSGIRFPTKDSIELLDLLWHNGLPATLAILPDQGLVMAVTKQDKLKEKNRHY